MRLKMNRRQKGAALVEYGLLVAGVALVATAAVSIFGTKTGNLIASIAAVLPGANAEDNAPINVGQLLETTDGTTVDGGIRLRITAADGPESILANSDTKRLDDNLGVKVEQLILDPR